MSSYIILAFFRTNLLSSISKQWKTNQYSFSLVFPFSSLTPFLFATAKPKEDQGPTQRQCPSCMTWYQTIKLTTHQFHHQKSFSATQQRA
jgi:hypothetical protein